MGNIHHGGGPRGPRPGGHGGGPRGGFGGRPGVPPPPHRGYRRRGGCLGPGCLMPVLSILAILAICVALVVFL